MLCSRIDEVVAELGVTLYRSNRLLTGRCPVHLGDNAGALNLYHKGDTRPGYWRCQTKACQETFGATILGFIRGVLSQRHCDWQYYQDGAKRQSQPKYPWGQTVDWCCNLLGVKLAEVRIDREELEKTQFTAGMRLMGPPTKQEAEGVTRNRVREFLEVPAPYFVRRGFSAGVLDRYDVGTYPAPGRALSGRVAVPIYDDRHRVAIGFTGRSVFEKCESCQRWHGPGAGCPGTPEDLRRASKWWNEGFRREACLYNSWFAKKEIEKHNIAVLCEGPGDVWRLAEAGIDCGVAMLGADLSPHQQVILEMSGAMNVIVLTDNDATGEQAREKLKQQLGRIFRLYFPQWGRHDVGETPVAECVGLLAPLLRQLRERGY